MSASQPKASEEERESRRKQIETYAENIVRTQDQRENQVRAILAAAATFVTLSAASVTARSPASTADGHKVATAQFVLCLLYAGVLGYYITSVYHQTLLIADAGAARRELELEARDDKDRSVAALETMHYESGARRWRERRERWPRLLMAAIPRYGQSQRHAMLFLAMTALLPAVWFSLAFHRTEGRNVTVIVLAALLAMTIARLFFAGCRHWLWADPRSLAFCRSPVTQPAPVIGWWLQLRKDPIGPSDADGAEGADPATNAPASAS
jgi:hypothetical protein